MTARDDLILDSIEAERRRARDRKQQAAALNDTGLYDRMLGYESALEWCAALFRSLPLPPPACSTCNDTEVDPRHAALFGVARPCPACLVWR